MNPFTEISIQFLKQIPSGKVATYGQIAYLAGNRRAARQIARILFSSSEKHGLPWHRVINAQGKIVSSNAEKQKVLLLAEGIHVSEQNRVNLKTFQWRPSDTTGEWMEG